MYLMYKQFLRIEYC